ncbi:Exocyst complex component EXO70A1, partial [Cucurbita argyrosperma subsp. argyrosperma]
MGDCESIIPTSEGEQHVIAAFQHLAKLLRTSQNVNDELKRLLIDLDSHLTSMTLYTHLQDGKLNELESRFKSAEEKIRRWESNESMIWDSGPKEACEYMKAVDEIHKVQEGLISLPVNDGRKRKDLLSQAESVIQFAMSRLEQELVHILAQHKLYFEPNCVPFQSGGYDVLYNESFASLEDSLEEETSQRESIPAVCIVNMVHPHVIPHLKSIANAMFTSNYIQEFSLAFVRMRKDALDEYLLILEMERHSIGDLQTMEWDVLNVKIKKWIWLIKVVIRVYLASEQRLCNNIFEGFGSYSATCFAEISATSMLCLLNFGEAIAMTTRRPEKLFRLLDMYEVLENLLGDIGALFSEDTEMGSFLKAEFHNLFMKLGDSARATFVDFGSLIARSISTSPFPGGGVHHLTKYVMNYIRTLTVYRDSLVFLLRDEAADGLGPASELLNEINSMPCPLAFHLQSITSQLISNLNNKSKLYNDDALRHIFLMNNIHYMVQKVKGSELRAFFGGEWIREHNRMLQIHANIYTRVTWQSVISLLRLDGDGTNTPKAVFKEKYRAFNVAFEEIYKTQTGWNVSDPDLRDDLHILTSNCVIQAYRFLCNLKSQFNCEKYIKYTIDDLSKHILDLFQGSPRSLQSSRRR